MIRKLKIAKFGHCWKNPQKNLTFPLYILARATVKLRTIDGVQETIVGVQETIATNLFYLAHIQGPNYSKLL